ncbi:SUMO-conjugating enzyme UBC9-A [Acropora cervicornis]|uniref:SUMO-conjugating enzyme UBC9-A n=1 Tax=Acropora cervicornis TaxID=6130 RepID=A0AAD9QX71_ACRCE|nr:SUMO-conjugating enzyme UBC9-A [Acropora cervicornis]
MALRFKMATDRAAHVDPVERLKEEHKAWKHHHPQDFIAEPVKIENGEIDWLTWNCVIPGPKKSLWEGGLYKLQLAFPQDYPFSPPKFSLSLIDKSKGWRPQTTTKEVLLGIQLLLTEPNFHDPAQAEAFVVYNQNRMEYEERVKKQAKEMTPNGLG